jgi:hypothetical protein
MRKPSAFGSFLDTVASAIAVSVAVREHRAPRASDLTTLGIDPVQFNKLGRY